jgi:biopolymer transport protein ExbD
MKSISPSRSGKYQVLAEINMIPLIDVSLVLLIIFMVLTPFLVRSKIQVSLPKAGAAEKEAANEKPLQIQVVKGGSIFIEGIPVQADQLEAVLRKALPDPATRPVMVEADKEVPFEHFVTVVDAAKKIGAAKFSIAVRQEKKTGR